MVQEVDELNHAMDVYEKLEKHYDEEGKIDPEIFAELRDEMEKFEGSEDDVSRMEKARIQFQVNESDAESSASARGKLFEVIASAFKTFATKQNIRLVKQRATEEISSEVGERLIEQAKQSASSEETTASAQSTQTNVRAEQGLNAEKFVKNIYDKCRN